MKPADFAWLETIVARAAPLWESAAEAVQDMNFDDGLAAARLERWRRQLGGELVLRRRFLASPLPRPAAERRLGSPRRYEGGELPSWACTLHRILAAKPVNDPDRDRAFEPDAPLPFQEALLPFVRFGRAQVARRAGGSLATFAKAARIALERQLLSHLAAVSRLALDRDFDHFRWASAAAPSGGGPSPRRLQERSTPLYDAYVRQLHHGGLRDLFEAYPVLARLLCQSVEQWEAATLDLLRRFRRDFATLRATFGWRTRTPAWAVAQLIPDLSHRYHGGRAVAVLVLATGEKLVYKPRPVEPERAFYALVDRLAGRGLPHELRSLKVVARDGYGWVEHVPRMPCSDLAEAERFYRRYGQLLALAHLLSATDLGGESLIASGEHPVLVDLESILAEPGLPASGGEETSGADWERRDTSVLRTGLLPRRGGEPPPAAYREAIAEGFAAAYWCLIRNVERLLADRALLDLFDGLKLRVSPRSPATYTRLQLRLLHPDFLADGIDRSIELEWLARPLGGPLGPQPGRAALYERERQALESLDLPRFSSADWQSGGVLAAGEGAAALCGEWDSRLIERHLRRFSIADLQRQLAVIREAIAPGAAAA